MFRKTLVLSLIVACALAQDDAFDEAEDAALDAADEFEDEAEDAIEELDVAVEIEEVAVVKAEVAADVPMTAAQTAAQETAAENMWTLLIGCVSILDVVWWMLWSWFIYIKTNASDATMLVNTGSTVSYLPLHWFWISLADVKLGWTALSYMWIFISYMVISLPEMVFWIMHCFGSQKGLELLNMWVSWPGLYGSWILYLFPVIFPIVQMVNLVQSNQPGYLNAAVSLIVMMISWLATGLVHVFGYKHVQSVYAKSIAVVVAVEAEVVEQPEDVEEDIEEEEEEAEEAF